MTVAGTSERRQQGPTYPRSQWRGLLCALTAIMAACASPKAPLVESEQGGSGAVVTPSDTVRARMEAFLAMAVAKPSPEIRGLDSIHLRATGTGEDWMIWDDQDRRWWIADGRVVASRIEGDSATVTVALTVVAEQEPNLDAWDAGYIATIGVREHTARWVMVRDREDLHEPGRWKVRGGALEGISILPFGRTIKWTDGGSEAKALALVDSIRSARRLPLVR